MKILYFTASGNSLHVAKSLGGELISIPQMIKENIFEFTDDKIGVVFPLYEWSVNELVADFLKKATFHTEYLFGFSMKKQMQEEHKKQIEVQITTVKKDIDDAKEWIIPEAYYRKKATKFMVNRAKKNLRKTLKTKALRRV